MAGGGRKEGGGTVVATRDDEKLMEVSQTLCKACDGNRSEREGRKPPALCAMFLVVRLGHGIETWELLADLNNT